MLSAIWDKKSVDWNRHRDLDRMPADDPFLSKGKIFSLWDILDFFWIYDVPTKSLNISEHDFGAQKINMLHAQKQRLIKKATATSKLVG